MHPLRAIECFWNHLVMLLLIAFILTVPFVDESSTCPITTVRNSLMASTLPSSSESELDLNEGVAYTLPAKAMLLIGSGLLLSGICLIFFPRRMQRTVSALVLIVGLALLAEELSAHLLIGQHGSPPLGLTLTLTRGLDELQSIRVDLACTSSLFAILAAISAGLHLMALRPFKRGFLVFEGAVAAVLFVRMLADFIPLLLETHPIAGIGHFFLGYPLVPFWATAVPLGFVVGAIDAPRFRVRACG